MNRTKPCSKCKLVLDLDNFTSHLGIPNGRPDCRSCRSSARKARYERQRSKELEQNKVWREANRDKMNALCREHYIRNKPYYTAKTIQRMARIKRATPAWLTKKDLCTIQDMYKEAALLSEATGYSWHVDHIIPLNGYNVCGLHVPENLQLLPWYDNLSKGNNFTT